jgi:hypothetical protein
MELMIDQQAAQCKPSYFRFVLKKQDNRVEYRVLSSDAEHYYQVQMHNGRAINCFQHDGEKCPSRRYSPGVPCKHMVAANNLEAARRMRVRAEKAMQQEDFQQQPETIKQVVKSEVEKCQEAFEQNACTPIQAQPGTREYWREVQKRARAAKRAHKKQYTKSLEAIRKAQEVA